MAEPLNHLSEIDAKIMSGESNTDSPVNDMTRATLPGNVSMTPSEDRIQALLDRWESHRERGESISSEELCREDPDLVPEVQRRIGILSAMEGFLADGTVAGGSAQARNEVGNFRLTGYEILSKLGEGGMGSVYLARQIKLQRKVAIKVLPQSRIQDPAAASRFEREMIAVGALNHEHIVQAHDAGEVDGVHYLVMELVEGIDLSDILRRVGPMKIADACELIRQAAVGLQYVHSRGLVHRDIKPSNLMLAASYDPHEQPRIKILDLGLALLNSHHSNDDRMLTSTGQMMGTIDYMSPEQAMDTHQVDIRADIYSLGATLYKLLTGRAPFEDPLNNSMLKRLRALDEVVPASLSDVRPDCPKALSDLLTRLLAKSPDERPAQPGELAQALAPFSKGANLALLLETATATRGTVATGPVFSGFSQSPTILTATTADKSSADRQRQAGSKSAKSKRRIATILGGIGAVAVFSAIVIFTISDGKGTLTVEAPEDLIDGISASIVRDGQTDDDSYAIKPGTTNHRIRSGRIEVKLPAGVTDEFELKGPDELIVRNGKDIRLKLVRKPQASQVAKNEEQNLNAKAAAITPSPAAPNQLAFQKPEFDAWMREVADLSSRKLLDRVTQKLVELNPGFDGKVEGGFEQGTVKHVQFYTDNIKDISPVRALKDLKSLVATSSKHVGDWPDSKGIGTVTDLSPLKGMSLESVDIWGNQWLEDLSPLAGMPLTKLWGSLTSVADLAPLKGMKLEATAWSNTRIKDISVLKRMPLTILEINHTDVSDLSPLAGMPIRRLDCSSTNIKDITTLKGMPLISLSCGHSSIRDLSPLQEMPLEILYIGDTPVADLRPLKGMPLKELCISQTSVTDVTLLQTHSLKRFDFYPEKVTKGIEVIRQMSSLETIGLDTHVEWPAAEFWKKYDAGEFGKVPVPEMTDDRTQIVVEPVNIPEPPSLEEWLKGRTILTVAQDGSGDFKTIQAALKSVQSGQAVKILDNGPYREFVQVDGLPEDIGLISEVGSVWESPEWRINWEDKQNRMKIYVGHRLFLKPGGFRLSGLKLRFADHSKIVKDWEQSLPDSAEKRFDGLSFWADGAVIENCWFDNSAMLAFDMGFSDCDNHSLMTIRECRFDTGFAIAAPLNRDNRGGNILITRNIFMEANRRQQISLGQRSFRNIAIRYNVFDGATPALGIQSDGVQRLEFSNNLMNSSLPILLMGDFAQGDFVVRNNCNQRLGLFNNASPYKPSKTEWLRHWHVDHNCYAGEVAGAEGALDQLTASQNTVSEFRYLSKVPNNPNYLRVDAAGGNATKGAGGPWPDHVGPFPPGPAPKDGDWLSRLMERWKN